MIALVISVSLRGEVRRDWSVVVRVLEERIWVVR